MAEPGLTPSPSLTQHAATVYRLLRSYLAQERLHLLREAARTAADQVRAGAAALQSLASGEVAVSRALQVAQDLEAAAGGLMQLAEDLERPFLLFVVGMGKFGKSTLINALLGQRVAAMDALPKTWKIDVFTRTLPPGTAEVRTYHGHVRRMPVEEAVALIDEEERRREASEERVWELFEERAQGLSSVAEKEVLRQELEAVYLYRSPIVEVKWPVPRGGVIDHFDVVDTPGLWQERPGRPPGSETGAPAGTGTGTPFSLVRTEDLRSYYLQADGVLWMLDATKLAAGKPYELIHDVNSALSRIGGIARNAVAVLNRIDVVRSHGGDEAVTRVVAEARRVLGGTFRYIIPISAREALEAREKGDPERLRTSGLEELLRVIDQEFRIDGAGVRWWSKSEGFRQYLLQVREVAHRYDEELTGAHELLEHHAATARQHLDALALQARQRLVQAHEGYRLEVEQRLSEHMETLLTLDDTQRERFLASVVFKLDDLRTRYETLLAETEERYRQTARELQSVQRFTAFRYVVPTGSDVESKFRFDLERVLSINLQEGDASDEISFWVASAASLIGAMALGPIGLALGPILSSTGLFKEYFRAKKAGHVRQNVSTHLDTAFAAGQEEWDRVVRQLGDAADRYVAAVREGSFATVHVPVPQVVTVNRHLQALGALADGPLPEPKADEVLLGAWVRHHRSARMAAQGRVAP